MNFLLEMWAVIASGFISWFGTLNGEMLSVISNALTILVIVIGLVDWVIRKMRNKRANKANNKLNALEIIENTQKSFKAVNILNDPMKTGEKIGILLEDTSKLLGGRKMKKVFKWIWYNKEQLLSIAYNIVIIVAAQYLLWTEALNGYFMVIVGANGLVAAKIIAIVMSLIFAALTVRNVCVKYGLSSLETIDEVLAQRAEAEANKLTPEQKQTYKKSIATLKEVIKAQKLEMNVAKNELERITTLYTADNALVTDFVMKRQAYEKKITANEATIARLESEITVYQSILDGGSADNK